MNDQPSQATSIGDRRPLSYFGDAYVLELADWGHEVPRGTTGVVSLVGDGEVLETWATQWTKPYALTAIYERIS